MQKQHHFISIDEPMQSCNRKVKLRSLLTSIQQVCQQCYIYK